MKLVLGFGDSLEPLVKPNSILEIDVTVASQSIGSLLVYTQKNRYIAHLCLFKKIFDGTQWYFLKGNSLLNVDGWIPEYRVVGRICSVDGNSISTFKWQFRLRFFWIVQLLRYATFQILFTRGLAAKKIRNYFGYLSGTF